MRNCTEFWMGLRATMKLYEKMLKKICTRHDLTVMEGDVMGFLRNNPARDTAADIVELRQFSKGAVSKAVEALIRKGFLERHPDDGDRRKIHLKLTDAAEPVLTDIRIVQNDFWDTVFADFTEEEYRVYEKLRTRIFENARRADERREEHE